MSYKDFLIDKRILQRNIDKGIVDGKQYEKHLDALPDRTENAVTIAVEPEVGGADEGDEGGED